MSRHVNQIADCSSCALLSGPFSVLCTCDTNMCIKHTFYWRFEQKANKSAPLMNRIVTFYHVINRNGAYTLISVKIFKMISSMDVTPAVRLFFINSNDA